ncbi:hypothetical protein ABZ924_13900 [Streptomyces sp. NPDC046876]|uniref:hypothetical protein n=1 Tax=Streptomyces sp. NPDC046876 TaxID=3155616 RepID=UPI003411BEEC
MLAGPRADPVRWLGAERDALAATVRQAARVDPYACREPAAAAEYVFDVRSDLAGCQALQEAGLAEARSADDRTGGRRTARAASGRSCWPAAARTRP